MARTWVSPRTVTFSLASTALCGHSAGGHLAAMMAATDWRMLDDDIPADIVRTIVPVSGIYELDPLRKTSINDAIGIDDYTAADYSPLYLSPAANPDVLLAVGGAETEEFHRQTRSFAEGWREYGLTITEHIEPDADHFDIVERLADPGSAFFSQVRARLR